MNALNRKERIPIQAAGSAGGFRRGGVDTIRGSFQHVHFTFDGQPLHGVNQFASHENIWR